MQLLPKGTVVLEEQLAALDALQREVQARWRSPDDFARIDLVVADLMHRGAHAEAVRYLEKASSMHHHALAAED